MRRLLQDCLQNCIWPVLFALGTPRIRRWVIRHVCHQPHYFATEVDAMLLNLTRYQPDADLQHAARQLRLTHLSDKSVVFFSPWARKRVLRHAQIVGTTPASSSPALLLGAHYGSGWWILPWLAAQGMPTHFVTAPLQRPTDWRSWVLWPLSLWRWHCLSRAGKAPLIRMRGATRVVRSVLTCGGIVNALIDIPPLLAPKSAEVILMGKRAYMPDQLIRIACDLNVPVWYCSGRWDADQDCTILEFLPLQGDSHQIFESYAKQLEQLVLKDPGLWHCWGHVDAFFAPPPTP